jgi:hypothetical protein
VDERFKLYAFAFLAARALVDLVIAGVLYYQERTFVVGFALLALCCVFYLLLFFGLRNEEFHGRYGRRVILWREPFGYWFVVGFLVLFHLVITALFGRMIRW